MRRLGDVVRRTAGGVLVVVALVVGVSGCRDGDGPVIGPTAPSTAPSPTVPVVPSPAGTTGEPLTDPSVTPPLVIITDPPSMRSS